MRLNLPVHRLRLDFRNIGRGGGATADSRDSVNRAARIRIAGKAVVGTHRLADCGRTGGACTQSLKMNCVTEGLCVRVPGWQSTLVAKGELANFLVGEQLADIREQVLHIVLLLQARGAQAQAKLAREVVVLDYAEGKRGVVVGKAALLLNQNGGALATAENGDLLPFVWLCDI